MFKICLILGVLCLSLNLASSQRMVCYYTNWAQYRPAPVAFTADNIDANLCNVIIYSFGTVVNNNLATNEWNDDTMIGKIVALKQKNPNLKVIMAVGGGSFVSAKFSDLVTNAGARAQFVNSVVQFLRSRNLDGLDVDWEFPANGAGSRPSDKSFFTTLLRELKDAFKPYNFILTAAVSAYKGTIYSAYEVANIAQYVDWINLMTYDFYGPWNPSIAGFNAALYPDVDSGVRTWVENGFPKNKIVLGVGTYGRSFTLANAGNYQPGAAASGAGTPGTYTKEAGFLAYYEICQLIRNGAISEFNSQQQVPFIHYGNQWAGYDDVRSVNIKADYIKSQGLAGAMFWEISFDDFSGTFCNSGKFPLITAVKQKLSGTTPTPGPRPGPSSKIALKSKYNNKYVSAYINTNSVLYANIDWIQLWETFELIKNSDNTVSLRSLANNLIVSADNYGKSPLVAKRDKIDTWEKFTLIKNSDGTVSFKAIINKKFVCAEFNDGAYLIANRDAASTWESFYLVNA